MNMFVSLCKRRSLLNLTFKVCPDSHFTHRVLRSISSSSSLLAAKKSVLENGDEHSFTVSYLINSCGLSSEKAVSVSKIVHFQTSLQPDSVITLLRNYGFAHAHVSKLVAKRPKLLLFNPEKTLLPKLEFLRSLGLSNDDIARLMSAHPTFLTRSLAEYIVPKYNLLKSLVGPGHEEDIIKAFTHFRLAFENNTRDVIPNMNVLREVGTPQSFILQMITRYPDVAFRTHKRFKQTVDYLKAMGFDPRALTFILAIEVVLGLGKTILEEKFNIYARWGWSKEDAISAFKYHPSCMVYTEKRIMETMDFFVNKMGFSSKLFARYPILLCFSLERRIIPRSLVARVLSYNGLIKKDFNLYSLLKRDEKFFLQNYVIKFQEKVPQLRDVYDRKVDIGDLGIHIQANKVDKGIDIDD